MKDQERRIERLEAQHNPKRKPRFIVLENDEPIPEDVRPEDTVLRFVTNVDMSKL